MSITSKTKNILQLLSCEIKGGYKSRKMKENANIDFPVDFVVTWVDDKDEAWQKEREKYFNSTIERNDIERYRNWDQFMYWFRSVEKYAPWVRKIHLVTCGHYPSWLNIDHEKINLVKHEDFIPKDYLPTFQTSPIELNFHRIKGLSEHFVFFNDDMLLNRPTKKGDFFSDIYPKCCNIPIPIKNYGELGVHDYKKFNNVGLINGHFGIRKSITDKPELWFNRCYRNEWKYHRRAFRENYLYGMIFPHLGTPMRKSTIEKAWDVFEKDFDMVCHHRFRTPYDVQQQIFTLWDIVNGEFFPVSQDYFGKSFSIFNSIDEIEKSLNEETELMLCFNDSGDINENNFEHYKSRLDTALNTKFPEKSSFEI